MNVLRNGGVGLVGGLDADVELLAFEELRWDPRGAGHVPGLESLRHPQLHERLVQDGGQRQRRKKSDANRPPTPESFGSARGASRCARRRVRAPSARIEPPLHPETEARSTAEKDSSRPISLFFGRLS